MMVLSNMHGIWNFHQLSSKFTVLFTSGVIKDQYFSKKHGSCVLKASTVECPLISLINTRSTSWSTFDLDISINTWPPLDTWSTSWLIQSTINQQSVIVDWLICIDRHLMVCLQKIVGSWPTVSQDVNPVSIKVSIEYWSSVNRGVNRVLIQCQSRVDQVYWSTLDCRCL